MTSPTIKKEDFAAKWSEYAGTGFPKYAVVHQKRAGIEAEMCVIGFARALF